MERLSIKLQNALMEEVGLLDKIQQLEADRSAWEERMEQANKKNVMPSLVGS